MSRVAGVVLPSNKKIPYALTYVRGIGISRANFICDELGISKDKRASDLSENDFASIRSFVDSNYKTEGDLAREESANIRTKISIRCYEGLRHQKGLPVRGQRTWSNANTRRKGRKG